MSCHSLIPSSISISFTAKCNVHDDNKRFVLIVSLSSLKGALVTRLSCKNSNSEDWIYVNHILWLHRKDESHFPSLFVFVPFKFHDVTPIFSNAQVIDHD